MRAVGGALEAAGAEPLAPGQQLRASLAANLRLARAERGWSLRELAARAEVSKALLSRIERGDGNPSLETLYRIAAALNCPVSRLIAVPPVAGTEVVRAHEGRCVRSDGGQAVTRLLFAGSGHGHVEICEFTMEPHASTAWEGHAGYGVTEVAIVESGRVLVGPEGEEALLGPGDAISFRHGARNSYHSLDEDVRVVSIVAYDRRAAGSMTRADP